MKKELVEILVCPACKQPLQLNIAEQKGEEIITGSLYCQRCNHSYPIAEAIANLLPTDLGN